MIAGFGDAALLLPASVGVLALLLWSGARSEALAFAAALAVCLGTTVLAKLALQACGSGATPPALQSPSGHASFAAVFYGCAALIVGAGRPAWQRLGLLAAACLLVLLVALSRVHHRAHTPAEVAVGLLIGAASVLLFLRLRGAGPPAVLPLRPMMLGAIVALALFQGRHLSAEHGIRDFAQGMGASLELCRPAAWTAAMAPQASAWPR